MDNSGTSRNQETKEMRNCPECGSTRLISNYSRRELVCNGCGLVLDENYIDTGPEWSAYDADQLKLLSRAGAPMKYTIHDKGLATDIQWTNRDSNGRAIPQRNRMQVYKIRLWQQRIRASGFAEKNLIQALRDLDRLSSNLGIPLDVRERAAVIYRNALKARMIRGRSIEAIVAASIYAACRVDNVPRSLDEISSVSRYSKKEIGRNFRIMNGHLRLDILPSKPENYINGICSKLKLPAGTRDASLRILKQAESLGLICGRSPNGIAAAAIYLASELTGEHHTQNDFAVAAGITEVTLRTRLNEFSLMPGIEPRTARKKRGRKPAVKCAVSRHH